VLPTHRATEKKKGKKSDRRAEEKGNGKREKQIEKFPAQANTD